MPPSMKKLCSILCRCCWAAFLVVLVAGFFVDFTMLYGWCLIGTALLLRLGAGMGKHPVGRKSAAEPPAVEVDAPVTGRWSALNSPADKVPSHGTRGYGQAYAIDIVAEPEDHARPRFGWWPIVRRSRDFPAFGQPLLAVADATVVHASDHRRDHLSRNSYPALLFLFAESIFRDVSGPGRMVGNHVILDLGGGTYAMYAHLQRGSLAVREGDKVRAGDQLARCGNSGNSSEPHVHFQLMDGPDLYTAEGVPFSWRGIGVPAGGEHFSAHALSPA